ncbi:hypothetical protein [Streptomyces formicae]|uniref:Peptidase inhibitor family I36 n=1 Tax=Streptomyces formicae TaxID=1616117 RepID=A0A291QIM9_9ACTN|nr:hypothetical protein [Streptomyces formicae]ATL31579.1 hypothetical protein KY5_6561 [Streptomyces formicae]
MRLTKRAAIACGAALLGAGLAATPTAAAGAPSSATLPCGRGSFCAYDDPNGLPGTVWTFSSCGFHEVPDRDLGAWVNARQDSVRMYDKNGHVVLTARPGESRTHFDWSPIWYIRLCD